ncbi:MAG TPA: proline dehydrogenase family protein [Isosphaeraceae bacterium]|jgi:RHH-type proline utilization regulon transcriptional repressor/proline dehydrogenase/delta 1-pyrroline-5-carboxylate dehydrogenase|nr:proline dehydrogenase family protein [Isosphaeraceae bacterium]
MALMRAESRISPEALEHSAREIGRALFERVGRSSRIWSPGWWDDWLMGLTLDDPAVKVQLFRFIDVLPVLKTPDSIRRHLAEYLHEAGSRVPWWLRLPLSLSPAGSAGADLLAKAARAGSLHMAHRFIAGETPHEALQTVRGLRARRLAFTADLLGEAVISEAEADQYQNTCLDLLRELSTALAADPEIAQIDRDHRGPIPRVNLSLKLTSLTPRFDAIHTETTTLRVLERLRPILRTARELGAFVNIDMEQYAYKDLTLEIVECVLDEPEFRDWADVGIVAQAYLPETENDLRTLFHWVRDRGTPITVRLVKGAYWDYEVLHAQQVGWPVPVFLDKWRTDATYETCATFLLQHHEWLRPALGSHNVRSLAHAMAVAEALGVPADSYEIQMLHGMGEPVQRALVAEGKRLRVYTPYGAMLPGMAYLVRRLLENTSNESFLKASSTAHAKVDDLLRSPEEVGTMWGRTHHREEDNRSGSAPSAFRNEAPTDFSRHEARAEMRVALNEVRGQFGRKYPLWIGGRELSTSDELTSYDPGDRLTLLGRTARARAPEAAQAVAAARDAFPSWSATPVEERAAVLFRAADQLRSRRLELAAWEVYECGKPWREADADVAEAIDYCDFYALEMLRLADPKQRDVPGETNRIEHIARGVAVVIPPWNFPLAIPTGMTVAALVAGNTVVLKPAEQSPIIAWQLVQALRDAGLPPGVLNYLPGVGEEAGQALVDDPRVDLIAFTGSRNVGLEINRRAAEPKLGQDHVKRVIAEMGGKNAIIIDDDADLDEAVVGVLQSAFSYAGQKCSACSRVIALEPIFDAFLARLVDAARDLTIGAADDPDTVIGPLIDNEARDRVLQYAQLAASEGLIALRVEVGNLADRGHFVGPMIVANVRPDARIAQEEIFGPILAVLRAKDLDEALRIADGTEYALTGGLYSRSPAHIDRVKRELRVGNLYINRPITGALVGRQPFGGFRLSGTGTKAGGDDYLLEFLLTRTITENTMRRGFAPELAQETVSSGAVPNSM